MSRVAAIALSVLVGGLGLTACSGGSAPSANSACSAEQIEPTITMIMHESDQHVDSIDSVRCSGDFAFVRATVSGGGSDGIGEQYIFESNGTEWVLKSPELVCGTFSPGESRPGDAAIPADLWDEACTTG